MEKYKVQLVNRYSGKVEEDFVDDMTFDSEYAAQDYANECNSSANLGREILYMSNPGDQEEDDEDYVYIVVEIDD